LKIEIGMKSFPKKLFLSGIGIVAGLLLAELAIRIAGSFLQKAQVPAAQTGELTFSIPINKPDPLLFWRIKPLSRFKGIEINSLGFRGGEISAKKRAGVFRAIALGDSCTLGVGVSNAETYSAVLQDILNKSGGDRNYEILDAGVAGYSSLQGLRYLQNDLIGYRPDVVTIYFGLNDYLYASAVSDRDRVEPSPRLTALDERLASSALYRLIKRETAPWRIKTKFPPERRVALPDFKRNLIAMCTSARKGGASVLLLNFPLRPDVPLVVNPVPVLKQTGSSQKVEWLRPAYIGKGDYYIKTEYEGPTADLEAAVLKYPQWAMAHYLLAKRYQKAGETEKAAAEFQKARETDFDREVAQTYNQAIEQVSRELKVPLVDLVTAFSNASADLFLDERHPSAAGHRLIAEVIYQKIKELRLAE
jgi:lysophospholipase L1-like esterase